MINRKIKKETDLCRLIDPEFRKEAVKILKELRSDMNSNGDCFKKEIETIRENL